MKISLTRRHHIIALIGLVLIAVIVAVILVLTLFKHSSPAATGAMRIAPLQLDGASGKTLAFSVRITPATKVDTVMAAVSYDPKAMTYRGIAYKDSPFTSQIPATASEGSITMQSALLGGKTVENDALVATLTFVATKNGTHDLHLTDGNAALAGVATNPILTDSTGSHESPSSKTATVQSKGQADATAPQAVPKVLTPITNLLRAVGLGDATAKRSTPWVAGVIVALLLVLLATIGIVIRKKRRSRPGSGPESKQL